MKLILQREKIIKLKEFESEKVIIGIEVDFPDPEQYNTVKNFYLEQFETELSNWEKAMRHSNMVLEPTTPLTTEYKPTSQFKPAKSPTSSAEDGVITLKIDQNRTLCIVCEASTETNWKHLCPKHYAKYKDVYQKMDTKGRKWKKI